MSKIPKILLADDDADIRHLIRKSLERDGYTVKTAADGQELMARLKEESPDVILLDLVLPDENGLDMMERIRKCTNAPVIVVSGKNDMVDKIVGLERGADDYVGKPFQVRELSARIKAHLRRSHGVQVEGESLAHAERIAFGQWTLDRAQLQVFDKAGASTNLTIKEIRLLEAFLATPRRVLSREQLLDFSRSHIVNVTDRAIDTQIVRIRKKLGTGADEAIQAVRGAGYILTVDVEILA